MVSGVESTLDAGLSSSSWVNPRSLLLIRNNSSSSSLMMDGGVIKEISTREVEKCLGSLAMGIKTHCSGEIDVDDLGNGGTGRYVMREM